MKKNILLLVTALFIATTVGAQELKPFKAGDRVAFVGNSITEAGYYESDIWLYYMTHFPNRRITVFNKGIGGDIAGQMNARFEDDIVPAKPTVMFLSFGMNDSGYFEFNAPNADKTAKERVAKSLHSFQLIQQKMKAHPEMEKIIMASSPYDETMENKNNYFKGKSKTMEQIVAFQKAVAEKNHWAYVDLFYPMTAINLREQKKDPKFTLTGTDRIHPGPGGHLVMASLILKAQGLAGQPVADVVIDAKKGKVLQSDNAQSTALKASRTQVSFNYMASSLPFPVDSAAQAWGNPQKESLGLEVYPFTKEFNREIIQVNNLKDGNYDLLIDGQKINTFSADSLSRGINMAVMPNTPQYQQAQSIMHLNSLRKELEDKLRQYYWLQFDFFRDAGLLFDDSPKAYDAAVEEAKTNPFVNGKMDVYTTARFPEVREMWRKDMKTLVDKIYEINKPKMHKIELIALQDKK